LMVYNIEGIKEKVVEIVQKRYEEREEEFGEENVRELERMLLLRVIDEKWMEHLDEMEDLQDGIGLRGYAERDPIIEYKFEALEVFEEMVRSIQRDAVSAMLKVNITEDDIRRQRVATATSEGFGTWEEDEDGIQIQKTAKSTKVGRNEPCPCGSGEKYKNCCGAN